MNCRNCGYGLWGIRERICPECGTPFKPSEFDFVTNSVAFCCPQCDQAYYGTGPRGHLVPPRFACVQCSAELDIDAMVLRPAPGLQEIQTRARENPWVERRERGWLSAWYATVIRGITNPVELVRVTPPTSGLAPVVRYAVLTNTLFLVLGAGWIPLTMLVIAVGVTGAAQWGIVAVCAAILVAIPVTLWMAMMLWVGLAHGLLRLTGPTAHGFARTAQAMLYPCGTNFLSGIPCLGIYFGWLGQIWWIIVATASLGPAQKVSTGRSVLAVVGPVATLVVIGAVGYGLVVAAAISQSTAVAAAATQASAASATILQERAQVVKLAALIRARANMDRGWPNHVGKYIADGTLKATDFLISDANAAPKDPAMLTVDGVPAADLAVMASADAAARLDAEQAKADGPAYRFGDLIICVRQDQPLALATGVWTFIAWPAVGPESGAAARTEFFVGLSDGSVKSYPVKDMGAAVVEQNAVRAGNGLPPIKEPTEY